MTTTITAKQVDIQKLIRNLKNVAYAHGQTDATEYSSDKKYRIAAEKSEEAAEALRLAIAQRDERIKELELSLKNVQDQCDFYEGEMYQNEDAVARDANRIAELEAEVKRKDEALNKYASASDVTCTYSNYPNSRSYDVYEHCEKWAREALAPKKEE